MLNEKIRISVTDLPTRPSRPTDEELEQIFGGGWFLNWMCKANTDIKNVGKRIKKQFKDFFRGW